MLDVGYSYSYLDAAWWPQCVRRPWPWALQKRLNRSSCRLGCWLKWAQGTTTY